MEDSYHNPLYLVLLKTFIFTVKILYYSKKEKKLCITPYRILVVN